MKRVSTKGHAHRKWYHGVVSVEMPMKEFFNSVVVCTVLVLVASAVARHVNAQESAVQEQPKEAAPGFRVVINAKNPTTELSDKIVSRMFYKRFPRWVDGDDGKVLVKPVDREGNAEVRNLFSKAIHGKSASLVAKYWQKMIFSGRKSPPPRENSDARVLNFVRSEPGGIGYVTPEATLGEGVKELKIIISN